MTMIMMINIKNFIDSVEYESIKANDKRELEERLDLIKKKATVIIELMDNKDIYSKMKNFEMHYSGCIMRINKK